MYKDEGVGGDYDYTDHPDLIYSLALQLLLPLLRAGENARARRSSRGWRHFYACTRSYAYGFATEGGGGEKKL